MKKYLVFLSVFIMTSQAIYASSGICVKAGATGANNGASWDDAYTDLQTALNNVGEYARTIWVAAGTYKPGSGSPTRDSTFRIPSNVQVYGGYSGINGDYNRNIASNPTILSGDIGTPNVATDNVYRVVTISTEGDHTLDGFTISGGYADGTSPKDCGGGVYFNSGTLTMNNCIVTNNYAQLNGGGVENETSVTSYFTNCLFTNNEALNYGGAIELYFTSTITNCTFSRNSARNAGGALYIRVPVVIRNSIVWDNTSTNGAHDIYFVMSGGSLDNTCYSNSSGDIVWNGSSTGNSCKTTDPQFIGGGNYCIKGTSACVDAGDNTFNTTENYDIRGYGYYRVLAGIGSASIIDMGAYEYMLGTDPVPVELVSLTTTVEKNGVVLNWKTATEINNAGFEIEKFSGSNGTWEKIGFVEGHGTSNASQSYIFTDNSAIGKVSYRLKQIDRDGKFVYSEEVEVTVSVPTVFALSQNYPNPFNPSTTISFTVPSTGQATLKIVNVLGQEVATLFNGEAQAGIYNQLQFNATGLASGMYFSRLEYNGKVQMTKMTLVK